MYRIKDEKKAKEFEDKNQGNRKAKLIQIIRNAGDEGIDRESLTKSAGQSLFQSIFPIIKDFLTIGMIEQFSVPKSPSPTKPSSPIKSTGRPSTPKNIEMAKNIYSKIKADVNYKSTKDELET